jgi:uncharacterized cupredoxin-like copper-binding protein
MARYLHLVLRSWFQFAAAVEKRIIRKILFIFKKENKMKAKKSLPVFLVLALFVMPLLTSCGPKKIDATLTTYTLVLSSNTAPAGKVTFHVTNAATDQNHEFVIFKTDLPEDQLPLKDDGNGVMMIDEEGAGVKHIDEIPDSDLPPGATKDLTVDLQPGRYVIVCNLVKNSTSHYHEGMHAVFTVN